MAAAGQGPLTTAPPIRTGRTLPHWPKAARSGVARADAKSALPSMTIRPGPSTFPELDHCRPGACHGPCQCKRLPICWARFVGTAWQVRSEPIPCPVCSAVMTGMQQLGVGLPPRRPAGTPGRGTGAGPGKGSLAAVEPAAGSLPGHAGCQAGTRRTQLAARRLRPHLSACNRGHVALRLAASLARRCGFARARLAATQKWPRPMEMTV
jgi:hypothetical protein